MPIIAATRPTTSGWGSRPVTEPARAVGGAQLLMMRWLAGRRRVTSVALAAAGLAATFAAEIDGGHPGGAAAAQIVFAAIMIISAFGESLLSPALPVIIDDPVPPGAAGRHKRLGTISLVTGCLLVLPAGGAALGADWRTSLLTTLAVASALASIAAQRLGHPRSRAARTSHRHPWSRGSHRKPAPLQHRPRRIHRRPHPGGQALAQSGEGPLQFGPPEENTVSLAHAASRSRAERYTPCLRNAAGAHTSASAR